MIGYAVWMHWSHHGYPYASDPIIPIGKQTLVCEGQNRFVVLDFEIIRSDDVHGKPALLNGKDSERQSNSQQSYYHTTLTQICYVWHTNCFR